MRERVHRARGRRVARLALVALALVPALLAAVVADRRAAPGFVVVVHADNAASSVSRTDLARIFTRKLRAWPGGGGAIEPVDLRDAAPARAAFLAAVMKKDAAGMQAYWQSQVFVGRTTPPPVKASEDEVLAHVAAAKGGVGYVAPGAKLPAGVKELPVED